MKYIEAREFLDKAVMFPVIDVRSPSEFLKGHIPGAFNIALFDDEERRKVGTLYKNSGKESSVLLGLDLVGPKMSGFVKAASRIALEREVLLHCWRGGMRSSGMAWLFETAGFKVSVLEGGYKAYRRFIRRKLEENIKLVVLGGKTGSGKSDILDHLAQSGEQVIDLEGIAHHKGSAFGAFGQESQPTTGHFENNLYHELNKFDLNLPVWVEDESRIRQETPRAVRDGSDKKVLGKKHRGLCQRMGRLVQKTGPENKHRRIHHVRRTTDVGLQIPIKISPQICKPSFVGRRLDTDGPRKYNKKIRHLDKREQSPRSVASHAFRL